MIRPYSRLRTWEKKKQLTRKLGKETITKRNVIMRMKCNDISIFHIIEEKKTKIGIEHSELQNGNIL